MLDVTEMMNEVKLYEIGDLRKLKSPIPVIEEDEILVKVRLRNMPDGNPKIHCPEL